jgi:hypothetical protein
MVVEIIADILNNQLGCALIVGGIAACALAWAWQRMGDDDE